MSKKVDSEGKIVLEQIIENIPYFVFWKNRNSEYLGCNKKFAESAGFKNVEDAIGKTDFDGCWTEDEAKFFRSIDKEVMDNDKPILNIEESQKQLDGSTSTLLTSKVPLHDSSGEVIGILGIYTDITERKNLEIEKDKALSELKAIQEQMIHSERIRSLGEMAGGIAHEINNPLSIIKGYAHLTRKILAKDEIDKKSVDEKLDNIIKTVDRIGGIVNSLRSISRNNKDQVLKPTKLSDIINDITSLCTESFKTKGINFSVNYESTEVENSQLLCDPISLSQVLINLLNNSKDAILEKDEKWIKVDLELNDELKIKVTDSGEGVDPDLAYKIFEPFFTTKEVGKGTGIGLSLSKGLLESQGADLSLDQEDKNTCFVITFPHKNIEV